MGSGPRAVDIGAGWKLWTDVELRGAGFPADWLLRLGDSELVEAAGALAAARGAVAQLCSELLTQLDSAHASADGEARRALGKAIGRLRKGKTFTADQSESLREAATRWRRAIDQRTAAEQRLATVYASAARRSGAMLRQLGSDPRFREALVWQNRHAVRTALDPLLRTGAEVGNSSARQKEELVASYLQRYCAKNDRIGFFGPNGWASLVEAGPAISARPGSSLLARRVVRLEAWALDALGDRLSEDLELRRLVAPRRMPTMRLDGQTLRHSGGRVSELPAEYAGLLAACDGQTSANQIARDVLADPAMDLDDASEVFDLLDELAKKRLVIWRLDAPTSGGRPEQLLAREIERLESGAARERAQAALAELESARDRVAKAAGQPDQLHAALDDLDATFVKLTGADSTRQHGKTYAGRTVAFEMCSRDLQLEVGPDLWQRHAATLRLLLITARWFCHELASRYRAAIGDLHQRMRGECGGETVEYLALLARLPQLFPGDGDPHSIVVEVRRELQRRWKSILAFSGSERLVRRSAQELAPAVDAAFAAPGPGWPSARHHSVDLLIARAEATGELQVVLGEIHPGMNVLLIPDLPHPYGDSRELVERRDQELGRPCVAPVWSRARTHVDYYSQSPRDYDVENASARSWRDREHVLAGADLVVGERDGVLEVVTRDRRVAFDIIAFLEHHLIAESHQRFSLVGGQDHTPRIEIDGLVLARERWSMDPSAAAFAFEKEPAARYAEARRMVDELGLPRFVFMRTPEETKPTYVDFDSPIYVELAARAIRRASALSLSEMLPSFGQFWLPDAQGQHYTSEIRLVAVDPHSWQPPAAKTR